MSYVWYYAAASTLFVGVTAFFFLRQRRIPTMSNRLFAVMLVVGALAALFDALAAISEASWAARPPWVMYALNTVFLLCLQLCLPLYLADVLALTGVYGKLKKPALVLLALPCATVFALVLLSPLGRFGVFYIDGQMNYTRGATHMTLYIASAFYLGSGCLVAFCRRHVLDRGKTTAIAVFTGVLLVSMALQIAFPDYLLTTAATGLGLTAVYHMLQSPTEFIDPVTYAFSRASLPGLLTVYTERNRPFRLIVFNMREGASMERALGNRVSENLLNTLAAWLETRYPRRAILRVDNYALAVIAAPDSDPAAALRALPADWSERVAHAPVGVWAYTVDSSAGDVMGVMDYLLQQPPPPRETPVVLADQKTLDAFSRENDMRLAFRQAMAETGPTLRFAPMLREDGSVWALDAYPCMDSPSLSAVGPETLERLAVLEDAGLKLWADGFAQVCEMAARPAKPKVTYHLSAAACMRAETLSVVRRAMERTGATAEKIVFSVVEAELSLYESEMLPTLQTLHQEGFSFMMDAFGVSGVNMTIILHVPFQCVRIGRALADGMEKNPRQRALLSGIDALARDVSVLSACGHVDTPETLALVRSMRIALVQGDMAAPPMNAEEAAEYVSQSERIKESVK